MWEQSLPHRIRDLSSFIDADDDDMDRFETALDVELKVAPRLTIQAARPKFFAGLSRAASGFDEVANGHLKLLNK